MAVVPRKSVLGRLWSSLPSPARAPTLAATTTPPSAAGNRRIGSFLFLRYLDKQQRLYRADGRPLVEDNALVAIALLVAESQPAQRDLVLRLILGLISEDEQAAA